MNEPRYANITTARNSDTAVARRRRRAVPGFGKEVIEMPKLWQRPKTGPRRARSRPPGTTSVSLSAADLAAIGRLLATGQAVLQERPPVVRRLKAAMTRLKVPVPRGL